MRSRLLALLLALAALAGPGVARADDAPITVDPKANSAIAYNTESGSSLFEFAFAIRHVMGGVVDQQNVAVAWSKCDSCQTTAIAIEIVLVSGTPSTVAPQNVAVAVNESCTLCDTFASAYQFVIGADGPVHLTGQGMRDLRRIRKEIESWGRQKLTNEQIKTLLPGVVARIKEILATQLVRVPKPDEGDQQTTSTRAHDAQPNAPPGSTATTETGTVQTTTTVPAETETGPATTTAPTTTTTAPTTTAAPTTTSP